MKTLSTIDTTFPSFFDDTLMRDAFLNKKLENTSPLSSALLDKAEDIWNKPYSDIHPFILNKRNEYVLEIPIPGFSKKEISLEVEGNELNVKAEKTDKQNGAEKTMFKEYSFVLPNDVNYNMVNAKCENGLLTVTIEKEKGKKAITIPVNGPEVKEVKTSIWDNWVSRVKKIFAF